MKKSDFRYLLPITVLCLTAQAANAAEYKRVIVNHAILMGGFGTRLVNEVYSLEPDNTYTFGQDNEGGDTRDSGTYKVIGKRIILYSESGEKLEGTISPGRWLKINDNTYEVRPD